MDGSREEPPYLRPSSSSLLHRPPEELNLAAASSSPHYRRSPGRAPVDVSLPHRSWGSCSPLHRSWGSCSPLHRYFRLSSDSRNSVTSVIPRPPATTLRRNLPPCRRAPSSLSPLDCSRSELSPPLTDFPSSLGPPRLHDPSPPPAAPPPPDPYTEEAMDLNLNDQPIFLMTICMISAGGFVGSSLCEKLILDTAHTILAVDVYNDKIKFILDVPRTIWKRTFQPLSDFGFGRRSIWEGRIGLFVTSGAVLLALTKVWLKEYRFWSQLRKYQAVLEFSRTCGICVGIPVRIHGVTIGSC